MIQKIKTYLECFGTKITPSKEWLPPVFYPSEGGWIAMIQEAFIPETQENEDPYDGVLNILSEQEFQRRFGKRRLMQDFKRVVNFWQEYGATDQDTAKTFMDDQICAYIAHRLPDWERMYAAIQEEYNFLYTYDKHEDITETLTKAGSEQTEFTGKEDTTRTGNVEAAKSGTEDTTRTGSIEDAKSGKELTTPKGTETVTTQNNYNGFNSSTSVPVSDSKETTSFDQREDELSFDQRKDTTTYNQLKDEVSFTNRKDTTTYNNLKDEKSFTNRKDTLSFTDRTDTKDRDGHLYGYTEGPQKRLQEELKMRLYDLATVIYKDIADHFLLAIY